MEIDANFIRDKSSIYVIRREPRYFYLFIYFFNNPRALSRYFLRSADELCARPARGHV